MTVMKGWIVGLLWCASLVAAFWVGGRRGGAQAGRGDSGFAPRSGPRDETPDAPRLEGRPPVEPPVEAAAPRADTSSAPGREEGRAVPEGMRPEDESLQLLGELEDLLQGGDLVTVLMRIRSAGDRGAWLIEPDTRKDRALRLLWLERLLANRQEVLDRLEDLLGAVADRPETLPTEEEGLSLEALAAFDDLLFALPRLSSPEQQRRFRDLLERIRASQDGLPDHLTCWDEGGCLTVWDHFAGAEEAMDRLASNDLDPREYVVLLRQVPDEVRGGMEPLPILQRMIAAGSTWRDFLDAARLLPPNQADVQALDDLLFRTQPQIDYRGFGLYACATDRARWPDGRSFVERCLEEVPRWRVPVLQSLRSYLPPPPASYVQGVLDRYDLGEAFEEALRGTFHIR